MKIILQRATSATVSVGNDITGSIEKGYVLLLGIMEGDTREMVQRLAEKIVKIRLFDGANGKINDQSILDINGGILVVSQFTLAGDLSKGNRPDFTKAASPDIAIELYQAFIEALKGLGVEKVASGEFGAYMHVDLCNDGPCTLLLDDSKSS